MDILDEPGDIMNILVRCYSILYVPGDAMDIGHP